MAESGHCQLFNDLISAGKERRRHSEAKCLGRLEVDHQLVFGRVLHWKVGGLFALKDAIDVASSLPAWIDRVSCVRDEATCSDEETERIDRRQSVSRRQRDDQIVIVDRQRGSDRDQTAIRSARKFGNSLLKVSGVSPTERAHLPSERLRRRLNHTQDSDAGSYSGVSNDSDMCHVGCDFLQQFHPFRTHSVVEIREPGDVAARLRQTSNKASADGIGNLRKYDW